MDMFSLSSNNTVVAFVPGDDASDPVTDLPTYAMQRLNPYPFGIDPVSEYVVINWLFVPISSGPLCYSSLYIPQ